MSYQQSIRIIVGKYMKEWHEGCLWAAIGSVRQEAEDLGWKPKNELNEIYKVVYFIKRENTALNWEVFYAIQNLIYNNPKQAKQVLNFLGDGLLKTLSYHLFLIPQAKQTLKQHFTIHSLSIFLQQLEIFHLAAYQYMFHTPL